VLKCPTLVRDPCLVDFISHRQGRVKYPPFLRRLLRVSKARGLLHQTLNCIFKNY